MIIIKGDDEAAIVARIEKELKGEEVDIFQSDETTYSMEQVLGFLGYNAKQARVYIGRIERNSRRLEENIRDTNSLLEPISMYFSALVEDSFPEQMLTLQQRTNKKARERWQRLELERADKREAARASGVMKSLEDQKATTQRLRDEGKFPE